MTFLNFELIFFDYVVLILTAVIVIFSFWKGFINSILGLLTWVGSVFVTIYSYKYLSDFLAKQLLNINFLQRFEQFVSVISIIISIPINGSCIEATIKESFFISILQLTF